MSTLLFFLPFLVVYTVLAVYAERKISAFMQDRLGPMEVGYYGILQTVADLIKLLQKEDIQPAASRPIIFKLAPIIIFVFIFCGFSVLPLSPTWPGSTFSSALFFLLAIVTIDVAGIILAGWASGNKYSTLGAMRSAVQVFSYEVPLGLSVMCACAFTQTLDLQEISYQQGIAGKSEAYLLGIPALGSVQEWGGLFSWNIFRMPLLFLAWVVFFIASLAESNRAPFDLPEAESELVAGYHTEYSGFRWAVIMLAEYAMMLLLSFVGVILFWGSWNTPLINMGSWTFAHWTTGPIWGVFWLISKTLFMVALQIWVRWTLPRVRLDQLINLCWKYLTPASIILLLAIGVYKLAVG